MNRENGFHIDPDESTGLADSDTRLNLVNSPHNPTGATISDEDLDALCDSALERGIQLVSDEVYPHVTVIGDLSKAFAIAGVRTGWMIERENADRATGRRAPTSRSRTTPRVRFSPKSPSLDETPGLARPSRPPRKISSFSRTSWRRAIAKYLARLNPQGGMTAFPWLGAGENVRPFCQAAVEHRILLAPGDCFDAGSHFRIGFAAAGNSFSQALYRFGALVKDRPARMILRWPR